MSNHSQTDGQHQLRKVAILVASLDDLSAHTLLAGLSSRDAEAVRAAVDQLGELDSAEQENIVRDFRRSMLDDVQERVDPTPLDSAAGVEIDASLLARIEADETDEACANPRLSGSAHTTLADADAATIAGLLANEHPQTIALVVSRLDSARAGDVLGALSTPLQAEVLTRLADLDATDIQTVEVVESQLAAWITDDQNRQQRMAVGVAMVQELLDRAPHNRREAILTSLTKRNPALAGRLSQTSATTPPAKLASSMKLPSRSRTVPPRLPPRLTAPRSRPIAPRAAIESVHLAGEFEKASDATLLAAMRQTDQRVVMLALVGADEQVLKRVFRRLPRRQAKAFRRQLRSVGPARLADMLAAEQELARTVRDLMRC